MAQSRTVETFALSEAYLTELFSTLGIEEVNQEDFKLIITDEVWDSSDKMREAVRCLGFVAKQIIAQFYLKVAENPAELRDEPTMTCGPQNCLIRINQSQIYCSL